MPLAILLFGCLCFASAAAAAASEHDDDDDDWDASYHCMLKDRRLSSLKQIHLPVTLTRLVKKIRINGPKNLFVSEQQTSI